MDSWTSSLLIISTVLNLFMGILILLQGYRGAFLFVTAGVALWNLSILSFYSKIFTGINWATLSHFAALLIAVSFYLFALNFPKKVLGKLGGFLTRKLPIGIFVLVATVTVFTDFVVGRANYQDFSYALGSLYLLYSSFIGLYFTTAFIILFEQFKQAHSFVEKRQVLLIFWGSVTSVSISTVVDLLLPYLGVYEYIWVGPFSSLLLVGSITVAILKYHLFSIRLIIVETALIVLNFLLFANAVFSKGGDILLLNILLSLSIFILSIFLIRGIYKDIRDRQQIEKLVKEMEQANQRLLALEQQKTEFVSIASHQLRTPMTVIKGYASMVLEGAFGALPKEAKEAMGNLYKSSERIVALIEDLLTVSRIEQGRGLPVFQTINFTEFMQELVVSFTTDARVAGLKLVFTTTPGSEGVHVALDKKKFEQAIRHIVDNAIKYTKTPGSIGVAISNDATNHKVFLSVSDTGMGMSEEQIKALLEKGGEREGASGSFFGFAIPAPKEKNGTGVSIKTRGIGFYIAQELIAAHYGTIRIESEGSGRGTTVVVELPEMTDTK